MKPNLLLDRTQVTQSLVPAFAVELRSGDREARFVGLCRRYRTIYIEEVGASGFERALRNPPPGFPSIVTLSSNVDLLVSPEEARALDEHVATLPRRHVVLEALRRYQREKGGQPRDPREVIGYAARLLLLARLCDADLFPWSGRAEIILALLDAARSVEVESTVGDFARLETDMTKFAPTLGWPHRIGVLLDSRGGAGPTAKDEGPASAASCTQAQIQAIHGAAMTAALCSCRDALLAGIDPRVASALSALPDPSSQMLSDLHALNKITLLDGSRPLAAWLSAAVALRPAHRESEVFRDVLRRIGSI